MSKEQARLVKDLQRTGVRFEVLSQAETDALLETVAQRFVDPKRRERFQLQVRKPPAKRELLEFHLLLRADRVVDASGEAPVALMNWLSSGGTHASCYRLDGRGAVGALRIEATSLDPATATSWPGLFVVLESGRALAVTLDNERFRCDVGSATGVTGKR